MVDAMIAVGFPLDPLDPQLASRSRVVSQAADRASLSILRVYVCRESSRRLADVLEISMTRLDITQAEQGGTVVGPPS